MRGSLLLINFTRFLLGQAQLLAALSNIRNQVIGCRTNTTLLANKFAIFLRWI